MAAASACQLGVLSCTHSAPLSRGVAFCIEAVAYSVSNYLLEPIEESEAAMKSTARLPEVASEAGNSVCSNAKEADKGTTPSQPYGPLSGQVSGGVYKSKWVAEEKEDNQRQIRR